MKRKNDVGIWNLISLLSLSKVAIFGLAIITSIALILNKTYQFI